ncbi:oligoendopeptidase F [Candidatus Shapirobacteria bacterium CG_4_9_14_3_um_filter_36_12]|uniref:Oligoendopeptidase F n=3 Tax=Candidatus Shapironibacteriota TaxID=1752721 RepID=A0A2M7XN89_9BACT|nr:MAG: oligoendopeptidase F [Candidatus Shapirobacteria bacterium CG03_land_8_20_14_0_80_35_14]PJA51048.1 MAG: oligoendopeptidase F [Candidatus Shapirobacteria bacterium CG_4_9_14_3_um_filter_36_12]
MNLKWNLDDILKKEEFEGLFDEVKIDAKILEKWIGKLKPTMSKELFEDFLNFDEEMSVKMARLGYLPNLMESINQKDSEAKFLRDKTEKLQLKISETAVKISMWLKGLRGPILDDKNAKRLFGVVKDLEYGLTYARDMVKHNLSEEIENLIINKDLNGIGTVCELREMMETEIEYSLKIGKKVKKIKTQSDLLALVYSPKAEIRKAAYRELLVKQKKNLHKFFAAYSAIVKDWGYEAKLRKYESAIEVRNIGNDIPNEAVDELLKVCQINRDIFHKFFKWKAGELEKNKLERFDIYAPLDKIDKKIEKEKAINLVLTSFDKFTPKFGLYARQIIESQHIDWMPKKDKRGGAFCATIAPQIKPYILLNFTDKTRDVSTLAHELGHGIHSMYAQNHYSSAQHAPLPLAETASTLAEIILFEEILRQETNNKIKKSLLADKMADSYATILRQNYFVMFEKEAHEIIPNGIKMEDLSKVYLKNLKDQFGSSVKIDNIFQYEWSYISHIFDSPFYCYAYNFGELLALGLYKKYKEDKNLWLPRIENILTAGGSQNPQKLLLKNGIDIESKSFWNDSFEIIRGWQRELERL